MAFQPIEKYVEMTLKDKLAAIASDDVYGNLLNRLFAATTAIEAGAGDEAEWYELFHQARAREAELLL